jgi:hypothetical protein
MEANKGLNGVHEHDAENVSFKEIGYPEWLIKIGKLEIT